MVGSKHIIFFVFAALLAACNSSKDPGKTVYQVEMSKGQAVAIDNAHGLMWQRDIDWKPYGFNERDKVLAYCDNLEYGGFTDWKVPTIDELRTMIVGCPSRDKCPVTDFCLDVTTCWGREECKCSPRKGPGKQGYYFDEDIWLNGKEWKELQYAYFWTSKLREYPDNSGTGDPPYHSSDIIMVNFSEGEIGLAIMDNGNHKYVRCVRKIK